MPIRAFTFRDENEVAKFMTARGISHHEVGGPYYNMNGAQYLLVDDGPAENTPPSGIPSVGMSVGTSDGGTPNLAVVGSDYTTVSAENLGAVSLSFSATLANTTVIPNSVVVSVTGSAVTLRDNGRGKMVTAADATVRGTIDYYTGAIAITFWPQDRISGTVEVDYLYSSNPAATGMPDKIELVGLSISAGTPTATVEVGVYNDGIGASLAFAGSTTLDSNGTGFIPAGALSIALDATISTRWVLLSGTDNYVVTLQWRRADM